MAIDERGAERMMSEALFAERRFQIDGSDLVVRFYVPIRAPGGEYRCGYVIEWPAGEVRRSAAGEDGIQALMLAMRTVHSELIESDAYKEGRLTLHGQADLDLPPGWGAGTLYIPPSHR
jgi:hypothetical protein